MPDGAFLPPWLQQSAEPADHMARGLSIGVAIGRSQAEEQFQQQQMAQQAAQHAAQMSAQEAAQRFAQQESWRQDQMKAQHQALEQAHFGLQAQEAARRSQGIMDYQRDVAGGMDPNEAILKHGPSFGANTAEAAVIRANAASAAAERKLADMPLLTIQPDPKTGAPGAYYRQGSPAIHVWPTVSGPKAMTQGARETALLRVEKAMQDMLKEFGGTYRGLSTGDEPMPEWDPKKKAQYIQLRDQYNQWKARKAQLSSAEPLAKAGVAAQAAAPVDKVKRAQEISAEHPDWSKQDVIDAVNEEVK